MTVEHVNYSDTLRQGTDKINAAIDQSNEAITTANDAKSTADQALANSENTQTQLDTIVINGDSSVEAAQARVDEDGNSYATLKERLDTQHSSVVAQLAEKANKSDLGEISNLQTVDKSSVVNAINELYQNLAKEKGSMINHQYYFYANIRAELQDADFSLGIINDSHFDDATTRNKQYNSLHEIKAFNNVCDRLPISGRYHLGDVINGDCPNPVAFNNISVYYDQLKKFNVLIGNHDDGSYWETLQQKDPSTYGDFTSNSKYSSTDLFNFFIKNNYSMTEYDFNTKAFYKDYTDSKIRVVCVNTQDLPNTRNADGTLRWPGINAYGISPAQLLWLNNHAFNFSSYGADAVNWKVIVMSHVPIAPEISDTTITYWDDTNGQVGTTTGTFYPNYYLDSDGVTLKKENVANEGMLRQMIRNLDRGTNNTLKPYLNSSTKPTTQGGYYYKTENISNNPYGLSRQIMTEQMHQDNYTQWGSNLTINGDATTDFSLNVVNPYPVKVIACLSGHIHDDKYHLMDTHIHHITLSALFNQNEDLSDSLTNFAFHVFMIKGNEFFIFRQGRNRGTVSNPILLTGSTDYGIAPFSSYRFTF